MDIYITARPNWLTFFEGTQISNSVVGGDIGIKKVIKKLGERPLLQQVLNIGNRRTFPLTKYDCFQ